MARPLPLRVLLVDDNTDAAESLQWLLQGQGLDVVCAPHAAGALAAWDLHDPAVALIDLVLPDMDGCDLGAEILRRCADAGRPAPRLIALSGRSDERVQQRAVAAGFARHLAKPIGVEALIAALLP